MCTVGSVCIRKTTNFVDLLQCGSATVLCLVQVLAERFHSLQVSAKILIILVNLVKAFDRRSVLSAALKVRRLCGHVTTVWVT